MSSHQEVALPVMFPSCVTPDHDTQDHQQDHQVGEVSKCAVMCTFSCLTLVGCKKRIVRNLAFSPPRPPGYEIHGDPPHFFLKDEGQRVNVERVMQGQPFTVRFFWIPKRRGWWSKGRLATVFLQWMEPPLEERPLIIFSHGNSTDIGFMFPLLVAMAGRLRVNVLCYDYSGYGTSSGVASEPDIYNDIKAVLDFALRSLGGTRVVLFGQSLGSCPAVHLAATQCERVDALILQSGVASGLRIFLQDLNKSPWFDAFRNVDKMKRVRCPVLLIHGQNDQEVPHWHSQLLLKHLPEHHGQHWWAVGAGHNDIEAKYGKEFYERIQKFLDTVYGDFIPATKPKRRRKKS